MDADHDAGSDGDDEVVCVGVGRARNAMPHARYDCTQYPFEPGSCSSTIFCEQCWCAVCSVSVDPLEHNWHYVVHSTQRFTAFST